MKSYGVTIQMKPRQQYFNVVLFVFSMFQTEIWDFVLNFDLGTLGSERVKIKTQKEDRKRYQQANLK